MARKGRQNQRVEPAAGGDGFLGFGLRDDDRLAGGPRAKAARSRGLPGRGRKKRGRRGHDEKRRGPISRFIRRVAYWCIVFTIIGTAGLAAVVGYFWAKLPPTSEWTLPKRPVNVRIVASDGSLITNRGDTAGSTLTLDEMPPYLPEAVIAIEDRRFWWHFGIDPIGLVRAAVVNLNAGGVVQGGSTLTQQLAKNLFLTPERSFERKIQEVILAVWLEASLTKKQILELYLNRVYLGAGAYGVDAAAHRYFGKSARYVTLAEAATLAGLLKAPGHYSPLLDPDAAERRAQVVLMAMRDAGYVTDREASLAMSVPIRPVRDVAGGSGRYVADWVMDILPGYVGALDEDIIVDTTIDMSLQALAAHSLATTLDAEGGKYGVSQGAFVAMDPNGAVRALVGGRDYGASPFNRAVNAHRQPGSAFKPFVYLTALEHGLMPETVRIDQPVTIKGWTPENYSKKYLGPVTLQSALALSLNTVSAQLVAEVGPQAVAATARRLGITSPLTATPSIALGTSDVTLLELTSAYAPFANGGEGVIPHVIRRIVTTGGKVLYERSGDGPGRVIDSVRIGMMNAMLRDTLDRGTGKNAQVPGWPAAGKTGTSQKFRDAWFIGYTGAMVAGVWFGNDDGKPTKNASGSNLPALAWARFMNEALAGRAVFDLPGNYRTGDPANFDGPTGSIPATPPVASIDDLLYDAPGIATDEPPPPPAPGPTKRERTLFERLFGG